MPIYIDYGKCYNGSSSSIGNANKINNVSISLKNITEEEQSSATTIKRDVVNREYLGNSAKVEKNFKYKAGFGSDNYIDAYKSNIEYYVTKFTLTLSYNNYSEFQNASDVSVDSTTFTGTYNKRDWSGVFETNNGVEPVLTDNYFLDENEKNIVEKIETSDENQGVVDEDDTSITYTKVSEAISDFEDFSPNVGRKNFVSDYPKTTFTKYDTYCVIEVEVITKIAWGKVYKASGILFRDYDTHIYKADYAVATINLTYRTANTSSDDTTIQFGEENSDYNFSPTSFMFSNGNTAYSVLDYSNFYSNQIINDFKDGKNTVEITIPVGNFEAGTKTTDILKEGDMCCLVRNTEKQWQTITDSFSIAQSLLVANEDNLVEISGIEVGYDTSFSGSIMDALTGRELFSYDNKLFPIEETFEIVQTDSSGNQTTIYKTLRFDIIENGILIFTDYEDLAADIYCSDCVIKQYKPKKVSISYDNYGNDQLYKVIYTNLQYTGMPLQTARLEPVNSEPVNEIYEVSENSITGIKETYKETLKIADIPYIIDNSVITEIGMSAFAYSNIEKLVLPFTTTKIDDYAFMYCNNIKTNIILPPSLKEIGVSSFEYSTITGDLIIPEGVTGIGAAAFANCESLNGTLSIPSTFKFPSSASTGRFENCTNLKRIIVYSSDVIAGDELNALNDFDNTGDGPIYVLDSLIEVFRERFPNQVDRIVSLETLNA